MERIQATKPKLNALIYAPPGEGKTTLAAQAALHPDLCPVLFLDHEGGLLSVTDNPQFADAEIYTERITNVQQIDDVFSKIVRKVEPYSLIKTVVVDSGTEMQALDIMQEVMRKKATDVRREKQGLDDPWPEDWGVVGRRCARIFRHFRDSPINFIMTAHTAEIMPKIDERKGKLTEDQRQSMVLEVTPKFTPTLRTTVTGFMDFVWCLKKDNDENRFLLTQPRGPYFAKTRGRSFPDRIGPVIPWRGLEHALLPELYECLIDPTKSITNPAAEPAIQQTEGGQDDE